MKVLLVRYNYNIIRTLKKISQANGEVDACILNLMTKFYHVGTPN